MPDMRPTGRQLALKTLNRVRTRGPSELLGLLSARVEEAVSSRNRLIVLARDAGGDRPHKQGFEFRAAQRDDAERYARDIATDSPETFRARLSSSTGCYVVAFDDAFLHATWWTTAAAWTRELQRYLSPPAGAAYVYESFTAPAARGRGLYPFALRGICADLATRGVRRVWVAVEHDNVASLRAVTKAGFEFVGELEARRVLGRISVREPRWLPVARGVPALRDSPPGSGSPEPPARQPKRG